VLYRQSKQRKLIWEKLAATREHPTATKLHAWLKPDMPGLSLGTVYRNLGILKAQGKIRELTGDAKQMRYDADLAPHGHFFCRVCQSVFDLELRSRDGLQCLAPQGAQVEILSVELKGVCPSCRRDTKFTKEQKT
jgi:Fur family transcriptional regulator, peroxide stress response regulator